MARKQTIRIRSRRKPKPPTLEDMRGRLISVEDTLDEINEKYYSRRRLINNAKRYALFFVAGSFLVTELVIATHFAIKFW